MLKSELIHFRNSKGQNIVGIYDHMSPSKKTRPLVVIPSAYGETKTDSVSISYFLVMNGFNVIRYDGTNHTGESDGDIYFFTLERGRDDLVDCIDFIGKEFGVRGVGVVAKSLAWRYAVKAAAYDRRIQLIAGIGGIVNLQSTIRAAYQEDLIALASRKKLKNRKLDNIFGFEISADFLETAVRDDYHNLESTGRDLDKLKIPVVYLFAEKDVWINLKDVMQILKRGKNDRELHIIPQVLHQIDENPSAAIDAFRKTVISCRKSFYGITIAPEDVIKPDVRRVALQNRIEKARLKSYVLTKENERKFWQKYLDKYLIIKDSKDFQDYLDTMFELAGGINKDEIILDGGCGPGYIGLNLLWKKREEIPFYVGADIVSSILKRAKTGHSALMNKLSEKRFAGRICDTKFSYVCTDMDSPWNAGETHSICFKSDTFDKIFCSLLISYVKDPVYLMEECFRMLKPNGKIVISTLKPHADLSQIYLNFVTRNKSGKDIQRARQLLDSAGMIRLKESQGYYRFYSEKELISLLRKANYKGITCVRTFNNQANLALGVK